MPGPRAKWHLRPGRGNPLGKVQLAVNVLYEARQAGDLSGDVTIGSRSVAIPTKVLQVGATCHANERLDLLQALNG